MPGVNAWPKTAWVFNRPCNYVELHSRDVGHETCDTSSSCFSRATLKKAGSGLGKRLVCTYVYTWWWLPGSFLTQERAYTWACALYVYQTIIKTVVAYIYAYRFTRGRVCKQFYQRVYRVSWMSRSKVPDSMKQRRSDLMSCMGRTTDYTGGSHPPCQRYWWAYIYCHFMFLID